MNLIETAKKVNELYQDYDPYDFEPDLCPPEEIAAMINEKDYTIPQDLMELITNCHECANYEAEDKYLSVFNEVMDFYR